MEIPRVEVSVFKHKGQKHILKSIFQKDKTITKTLVVEKGHSSFKGYSWREFDQSHPRKRQLTALDNFAKFCLDTFGSQKASDHFWRQYYQTLGQVAAYGKYQPYKVKFIKQGATDITVTLKPQSGILSTSIQLTKSVNPAILKTQQK